MSGFITVITGPMFAGKTTYLVELLNRHAGNGESVDLIRSSLDTRKKFSHNEKLKLNPGIGIETRGTLFHFDGEFLSEMNALPDVIGIDEGQFFLDLVEGVLKRAAWGIRVYVAGLSLDAEGRPFGQMPLLLAHADEVIVLRAECAVCGEPASMTRYKGASPKETEVLVGGEELYEPVCRRCWRDAFDSTPGRR